MRVLLVVLFLTAAVFDGCLSQVYYHPVQVLIPTYNGTHLATNYSVHNPSNVNSNQLRPNGPGNYPNSPNSNNYNYNQISQPNNGSQDGHLFLGVIQPYDRLLYNQEFTKPRRWWSYRESIVEYPKDLPAGYSRHETITALRICNKFLDGLGAKAYILNGGIGRQFVKIKLVASFGKGFRYSVDIYGR
ncbi:unnamed protein product [Psylliodes chrysocephalus]|uniref:Uncharacterized protein n=1 Tax=Psylliodes chrysocephalus TaxID=3402493 RepID=A0A9P0G8M8_9CUCU|nr:unnamed protein product [Psylliodes chrysocephala]